MLVRACLSILLLLPGVSVAEEGVYEINGSPFSTADAPIASRIKPPHEKVIIVDPKAHVYGAYQASGKLLRWGIASAGKTICSDSNAHCRTHVGTYRIFSLGNADCFSHKYDGALMPYCMYFHGSEAIHGSNDVAFGNISHGCVRVHIDDAEWLRYHFAEAPSARNAYLGTKIIIKPY